MDKYLPENTRSLYQVKSWPLKSYMHKAHFGKFGDVDLKKVTPALAEALIKKGFPYLQKRENHEPSKSKRIK